MQKIVPCLWCDQNAQEAAEYYVSAFENSHIDVVSFYPEGTPMPAGGVMTVVFTLCGREFITLNGGPLFPINPSISFFVDCETTQQLASLWEKLSDGGKALMPLDRYPFSEQFGWMQDRYGVSWQLSLSGNKQRISSYLMFSGAVAGKAEEAISFYCRVFKHSKIWTITHYQKGTDGPEGSVMSGTFQLEGQPFIAADSFYPHDFAFNEGISHCAYCQDQSEIDRLWQVLTEGGKEQPCGWVTDRFGVSWQIVPSKLDQLMDSTSPERTRRVTEALYQMKKIDLKTLEEAYRG